MAFKELRVHGVSGTPPREMLYTDPVTPDGAADYTKVYRVPRPAEGYNAEVRAFHWGGLTAGSRWTAFWIFLAPFALANVAGWLVWKRWKGSVLFVRLAGLALTALFVSQIMTVVVTLHNWLHIEEITGAWLRVTTFGLVIGSLAFVFWIAGWLSTQSHFAPLDGRCRLRLLFHWSPTWLQPPAPGCRAGESSDWTDPTDPRTHRGMSLWCADPRLWKAHSILHRIRRLHLSVGFTVIATVVTLGLDLPQPVTLANIGLILVAVILLAFTTLTPEAAWLRPASSWLSLLSAVWAVVIAFMTLFFDPPAAGAWPAVHETNLIIAVVFGAFAFGSLLSGAGKAVGALAFAAFFGSAMGIAATSVLEQMTAPERSSPLYEAITRQAIGNNGATWVAVWMLVMILVVLLVAGVLSFIKVKPEPDRGLDGGRAEKRTMLVLIRRITHRVQYILWAAVGVGAAATMGVGLFLCDSEGCAPSNLRVEHWGLVGWLLVATLAVLTAALWDTSRWARLAVPEAAAATMLLAKLRFLRFELLGVEVDLTRLGQAALAVAVLLPASFFLRSITAGIGSGEERRKTGLLWDVASFWPRYFHPLGPPAYGPNAVTDLGEEIVRVEDPIVLSAHSQGSMITAITLSQLYDTSKLRRVVTYGSPLGLIYGHLFFSTGLGALLEQKAGHAGLDWKNLWRRSDYLGGLELGLPNRDQENYEADDIGHSGYECTRQFTEVTAGLAVTQPPDDDRRCREVIAPA